MKTRLTLPAALFTALFTGLFTTALVASTALGSSAFAANASYTVPVDNEAATNPTTADVVVSRDGSALLRYQLPEDIVGQNKPPIEMRLVGRFSTPNGPAFKFKDASGWSVCTPQAPGLMCTSDYDHVPGTDQVESFLQAKFANSPALLAVKLTTAKMFRADPIGILVIECAQLGCGL